MDQEKREYYGREVRRVWVEFAKEQGDTKPGHLLGWNDLDDANKEVDMRIGEAIVTMATHEYARLLENEQKLLALLKEAELLILTAPTSGGPTLSNPKWHEWQAKKTVWLKQLSHTLIIEMNREETA